MKTTNMIGAPLLVAVLAVYAVVGITMLYGSAKIRRQNIIEGLRQENI